ncbi:MAG: polyprenyl synthetase family protein [Dehalococcoidia bacterium]|nr:polyprenyl synthetase family protein [Dehalococcoidia bacterium]
MPAPAVLSRYSGELDGYLRSLVAGGHPPALYRMLRYHLGWEDAEGGPTDQGGKVLRPALCLLACEAAGGDWRKALPAAAGLELVHNFSLIHDDVQDRDPERRHRPTVWRLWGDAQAINAGDALLALARLAVLRMVGEVAPQAVLQAVQVLDQRTLEMVEGQVMDIEFEQRLDVSVQAYLQMIEKKTGALFDASLSLGALAAGADARLVEAMGSCGRLLGLAFQVRDDMLGVWGAEGRTGKRAAADIRRRKKSLPAVYALASAEGDALDELRRIYRRPEPDDEDVARVLRLLDGLGAREYCAGVAAEKMQAALAILEGLALRPEPALELRQTAEFLLEREF